MKNGIIYLCAISLMALTACTGVPEDVSPVGNFDAEKYAGKWYEIARLDHSFEQGLSNVTATYTLREDGGIDVVNRGFSKEEGEWDEAKGKAFFVKNNTTGHLKVSFFGPFYASYVVMALDKEEYQYALVTGPDKDYLWILAREQQLSDAVREKLLAIANQHGYDTDKLIWVSHRLPN